MRTNTTGIVRAHKQGYKSKSVATSTSQTNALTCTLTARRLAHSPEQLTHGMHKAQAHTQAYKDRQRCLDTHTHTPLMRARVLSPADEAEPLMVFMMFASTTLYAFACECKHT